MTEEELISFKNAQRESWGLFAPLEMVTTLSAATLVTFSGLRSSQAVLDVGCGTGVVAITAARKGASVSALDLSPALLEKARHNLTLAKANVEFREGDVEILPYPDQTFDVVLSQFGHMFAPRPSVAIKEMLRVLKPGGTIAFSTWPPHLFVGRFFTLAQQFSSAVADVPSPALWGDPNYVNEQLGDDVDNKVFDQGLMKFPALSFGQYLQTIEKTLGPVVKLVQEAKENPARLEQFRKELEILFYQYYEDNFIRQHFLMTRARKR